MLQPKDTDWLKWIQKQDPYICCLLQIQGHKQTKSEGMGKGTPCKWKSKESWSSNSHIRQNIFKIKTIIRDKEGHDIMIKGSIQEEDITIANIYAANIGTPQYIRQMLTAIKGEIDSSTTIVGNFNTPLSPMDRSIKLKINKETQALNDTLNKMDLIDICRTF